MGKASNLLMDAVILRGILLGFSVKFMGFRILLGFSMMFMGFYKDSRGGFHGEFLVIHGGRFSFSSGTRGVVTT